jgi:threonine/homoserine/homoserine lactone efflux protein
VANLFALVAATTILIIIPGPNVALIVANSIRYGFRMGATFGARAASIDHRY